MATAIPKLDVVRTVMWRGLPDKRWVSSQMGWSKLDPGAVHVHFYDQGTDQWWTFGRELLASAMITGHSGEGDVTICRGRETHSPRTGKLLLEEGMSGDRMWIFLVDAGSNCPAILTTEVDQVQEFLRATFSLVPVGEEQDIYLNDFERMLQEILDES